MTLAHARVIAVAGVVALAATGVGVQSQRADRVAVLANDATVKVALARARSLEPQTLADQVRFCEVAAPPFGEAARGELLRQAFVAAHLRNVRVDRVGNVLGDRPGLQVRPHLVLAAHLDTVFPKETRVAVTRNGSTLSGPGIGDNCRGLAVLVATIRALDEAQLRTTGPVTFVANVGEEGLGDLRGVKALFGQTMKGQIDRFVTLDNAGILISTVGVGSLRYRVTFRGSGGHSFADFGRANPANALGRAIARLAEFRVASSPRTTFNVGRVGGGTSVNAIPEAAWMEVDLRSSDAVALKALEERFLRAVDTAGDEENARWGRGATVRVEKQVVGDRPAGSTPAAAPIVQTAQAVARVLGLAFATGEASSDANLPMNLGIPAIAIGAGGQSTGSHTEQERFDLTNAWQGTQNAVLLTVALAQD